jgi:hypothetical protein
MDEAALVQKDLLLAQKGGAPTDIDRGLVAKRISEALSLQYLGQASEAKLEQAKRLLDEFNPLATEILAATAKYKDSKHSEADFDTWYDAVSEGFGKVVTSIGSASKTSNSDVTDAKDKLDFLFDRMEEATDYADKVTTLAVASQRSSQASIFANVVTEQNNHVLEAMEAYSEKANGGFVDKKFGKTYGIIQTAVATLKQNFQMFAQINEKKVQEVQDAKARLQNTPRSPDDIRKAVFRLVAMDKALSRTEVAQHVQFGFFAREGEFVGGIQTFSQSKRTEADLKTMRTTIGGAIDKTEAMVKSLNDDDKKSEKASKDAVIAAFSNLVDEGEFVQKLMKFATAWGRQRIESDMLNTVLAEKAKLTDAFNDYAESFHSGNSEKAFGPAYKQMLGCLVTIKSQISSWVTMSTVKETQIKDDNLSLKAWMKQ